VLTAFFVANALIAEFIGVKLFSLEGSLGLPPLELHLFGSDALGFNLSAGVLLWPVVFVMTDVVNEYYGRSGVQIASFLTAALILYAFIMVYGAIALQPAAFWQRDATTGLDRQQAFGAVFGQGLWIIAGSLVAFLVGQFVDVFTFQSIKRLTGQRRIWLRATGSTLVSQLIDSYVVLFIAFYLPAGSDWSLARVLAVGTVNYSYKVLAALALTPLLYGVHALIDRYLGHERAAALMQKALLR
jgi:uncharacterized integral membrane protein (TIGR00697 family)